MDVERSYRNRFDEKGAGGLASNLHQAPWLVSLYLKLRPMGSAVRAKQFFIVAKKPAR